MDSCTFIVPSISSKLHEIGFKDEDRSSRTIRELYLDLFFYALIQGHTPSRRPALPFELANIIASYVSDSLITKAEQPDLVHVHSHGWGTTRGFVLKTQPIYRVPSTLRLRTFSRDQGWADDPSEGNNTWFQLHHKHADIVTEDRFCITHRNRHANPELYNHKIILDADHAFWTGFVPGEIIELYAYARLIAWRNEVQFAEIEIGVPYAPNFEWIERAKQTLTSNTSS